MVNTEDFSNRLTKIMEFYELSAAAFADRIDVGRSSISHIISGRNKPSLEFVMKVVKSFPEVELYWLLNGKGSFPKSNSTTPKAEREKIVPTPTVQVPTKSNEAMNFQEVPKNSEKRTIQKIVIFYDDGTFDAFEN
ncbi:MAG: helix-turn-helix transcriptional regulator [Christiangramia sp.]